MVSFLAQVILAGGVAGAVGWTKIRGVLAEYVDKGLLELGYLEIPLLVVDGIEIDVRLAVRADLVAGVVHSPQRFWPGSRHIVDGTAAPIDAIHEECGLAAVLAQGVKDVVGINVWSVVKSKGYSVGDVASFDYAAYFPSVRANVDGGYVAPGPFATSSRTDDLPLGFGDAFVDVVGGIIKLLHSPYGMSLCRIKEWLARIRLCMYRPGLVAVKLP